MTTSQTPVFDKEKAKQAWLKILKGLLFFTAVCAAGFYGIDYLNRDTPLETAIKAADVEAVRTALGPADSLAASERAYRRALEGLSPENPATTEILKLVLARMSQRPVRGVNVKPADHTFVKTRSTHSSGSSSSAVELAAGRWSPDGVRLLLEHGLTIRSVGVSDALVTAASNGAEPIITMLLDAGADVNGRDQHNDTALAMARRVNNDTMVKLLLARGAREN